ncbi:hypothetical protein [Crenothrix sp.]
MIMIMGDTEFQGSNLIKSLDRDMTKFMNARIEPHFSGNVFFLSVMKK